MSLKNHTKRFFLSKTAYLKFLTESMSIHLEVLGTQLGKILAHHTTYLKTPIERNLFSNHLIENGLRLRKLQL
jgi:hypothetical protein